MGFFKSKKGSIISDYFSIETDLGQFKKGNAVDVALFPDHLELQNAIGNKKTATLAYRLHILTTVTRVILYKRFPSESIQASRIWSAKHCVKLRKGCIHIWLNEEGSDTAEQGS